jgi:CO/xanthine dehydrogenase Mo-binding subunit
MLEERPHGKVLRVDLEKAKKHPGVKTVIAAKDVKAMHRDVIEADESYALREPAELYAGNFSGKNDALRSENSILWDENLDSANT